MADPTPLPVAMESSPDPSPGPSTSAVPEWPPVNQTSCYVTQAFRGSGHGAALPLRGCVDQHMRDEILAEVSRDVYYRWREMQPPGDSPMQPLLTFSRVSTVRDLASMMLHMQFAAAVSPVTGDLVDRLDLNLRRPQQPKLFVDLVGDRVGRHRDTVSMVVILVCSSRLYHLFLVDALALGADVALDTVVAWDTSAEDLVVRLDLLHPKTVEQQVDVAMGRTPGADRSWFAPVEVAVSCFLPCQPRFWSPKRPKGDTSTAASWMPGHVPKVSLRNILEASGVTKVFFDVRSDADVLLAQHQLRLRGALDLQLMEVVSRPASRPVHQVYGLEKCLSDSGNLPQPVMDDWRAVRERGRGLFQEWEESERQRQPPNLTLPPLVEPSTPPRSVADALNASDGPPTASQPAPALLPTPEQTPPQGPTHPSTGSTRVCAPFARRPFDPVLLRYAVNNVQHLPTLFDHYWWNVHIKWMPRLVAETVSRVICVEAARPGGRGSAAGLSKAEMSKSPWPYPDTADPSRTEPPIFVIRTEAEAADVLAEELSPEEMKRIRALKDEPPPFLREYEPVRHSRSARRRFAKKEKGLRGHGIKDM